MSRSERAWGDEMRAQAGSDTEYYLACTPGYYNNEGSTSALTGRNGFYGGGTGEFRDIVCMGPPFIIDDSHVETMADVLATAIDRVCA